MTKAGPSILRMALYQAGEISRRNDPNLAAVYYRDMVHHGKNHRQAMGAVMSHLGARVLRMLKEGRPYEIRDLEGKSINKDEAKRLILSQYYVSEEVRRDRQRRNTKMRRNGETSTVSIHEAAKAPQAE
jgi:hypothetical protein